MRDENRRLLLNGLFSNTQCIHRYPRVNREMMAKDQGQDTGTPEAGLSPLRALPLPHTPSQTHSHLQRLEARSEARACPAGTPGLHSPHREATRRAGHGQTAGIKARLAALSLAVLAASLRAWPAPGLPRSKAGPEPAPRTLPGVSKPFLNARISIPLLIFNCPEHSN